MSCPICEQKAMNCDCTETEIQLHEECEDLYCQLNEKDKVIKALAYKAWLLGEKGHWALEPALEVIIKEAEQKAKE